MTAEEAVQAMTEGKKVSHRYFSPGEYIYMKQDGFIYTEDDACFNSNGIDFWTDRKGSEWQSGYQIYPE